MGATYHLLQHFCLVATLTSGVLFWCQIPIVIFVSRVRCSWTQYHCYLQHPLLHSFIPSFVHSFIPSFLHSFIPSFLHSFIPSFLHSFIPSFLHSFIRSFVHSFIRSFAHSLIRSFAHSLIRSFAHSLTRSSSFVRSDSGWAWAAVRSRFSTYKWRAADTCHSSTRQATPSRSSDHTSCLSA